MSDSGALAAKVVVASIILNYTMWLNIAFLVFAGGPCLALSEEEWCRNAANDEQAQESHQAH